MTEENPVPTQDSASSAAAPPEISGPPSLADGVDRQLDPQYVPFQRTGGLIVTTVVSGGLLLTAAVAWLTGELPRWAGVSLAPAWFLLTAGLAWFSYRWPALEYRYARYRLDADGIEIRSGVWWRVVLSVPRSRVQHIDVSQGPLERSYGLGRLVIFTAGTAHSRVELPGLRHAVAFQLRNHLLPGGTDDAV